MFHRSAIVGHLINTALGGISTIKNGDCMGVYLFPILKETLKMNVILFIQFLSYHISMMFHKS